jgi:hypothetical protein
MRNVLRRVFGAPRRLGNSNAVSRSVFWQTAFRELTANRSAASAKSRFQAKRKIFSQAGRF